MPFFIFEKKAMRIHFAIWAVFTPLFAFCQSAIHSRTIKFPNPQGYILIVSDLHQHTVFSDGSVWPDIRVQEATKDGVDLISLTEHIEYQPHGEDIPHPDRNRSFELAKQLAKPYELMVVHGAEITRTMPPGHNNAIFINDANKLLIEDSVEVSQLDRTKKRWYC
jgi:hypothetical protein